MCVNFLNFRKLDPKYFRKFPLVLPTRFIYGVLADDLKNHQGYLYPMDVTQKEEYYLRLKIERLKKEQDKRQKKEARAMIKLSELKDIRTKKCKNSLIHQIGYEKFKEKYGCDENGEFGGGGGAT